MTDQRQRFRLHKLQLPNVSAPKSPAWHETAVGLYLVGFKVEAIDERMNTYGLTAIIMSYDLKQISFF